LAAGSQSIAVGSTTVVNGDNGVGIGDGAVVDATAPGGVAIGQQSHSAAGEVDIGNRQITGVAAGKAGTDAVNVSQLAAVTTQLTTLINNQSGGGGGAPFSSTPGSSPASTGPNSSAGGQGSVASDSNSTVYRLAWFFLRDVRALPGRRSMLIRLRPRTVPGFIRSNVTGYSKDLLPV